MPDLVASIGSLVLLAAAGASSLCPRDALNILAVHLQSIEVGASALGAAARKWNRSFSNQVQEGPLLAVSSIVGGRAVQGFVGPEISSAYMGPCDSLLRIHLLFVGSCIDSGSQRPFSDEDRSWPSCHLSQVGADLVQHIGCVVL